MKALITKLNLQLFATTMTTTTGDVNASHDGLNANWKGDGLTPGMKTFYDKAIIKMASPLLVHSQFAQKRPIPKNGGKEIEFRKYKPLTKATAPLTEGVTPAGNKLDISTLKAELAQYGDFIEQSDVLQLTHVDNTVVEATGLLGNQAGLTIDTIHRNVMQSGLNVYYCPKADGTVVTSRASLDESCKLTVDVVKRVVAILKKSNTPKIDGHYVAIIHPFAAYDIMSDPKWEDAQKYTNPENIYEGELGRIAGVRFVESSEAKIYTGDGCPSGLAVFGTLILGANAYGVSEVEGGGLQVIVKQLGSSGTADPLNQRSTVGWKAMTTAEILVEDYMIRVESVSALNSVAEAN